MKANIKYQVILNHSSKYSITAMCHFFNVSRSGYYDFVKRIQLPGKDNFLRALVMECHNSGKYMRTYGCRRVGLWIERVYGLHYNCKTVWRVMHKYGLLSFIRRKRFFRCGDQLKTYPNLLNRNFLATKPNQKWVTDISYIQTKQGVLYLSMIRDLFDRSIVAYKTAASQSTKLVLDTIKAAMKKEKITAELQLHSDQGFQVRQEVA